jgi:hypothetical protein
MLPSNIRKLIIEESNNKIDTMYTLINGYFFGNFFDEDEFTIKVNPTLLRAVLVKNNIISYNPKYPPHELERELEKGLLREVVRRKGEGINTKVISCIDEYLFTDELIYRVTQKITELI